MDELNKTLANLLTLVTNDSNLDDDDKEDMISLINDVVAEPTPNNLEALAVVVEELGKTQEYLAAKEVLARQAAEEDQSQLSEPEAEASVPAPEAAAPVVESAPVVSDTTLPTESAGMPNTHDAMSPSELPQVPPMEVPPAETPVQQ